MDYFDHPALSQSKLKDMKQSPAHFYEKHVSPLRQKEEPTDAMIFGNLVHSCVFEPETIKDKYFVLPKINRKTNEGKATYQTYLDLNVGKLLVDQDDLTLAEGMRRALFSKKAAQLILLKNGLIEKDFYFIDEFGIECKMKLDFFIEPCNDFPSGVIVDYKTTPDARVDEFTKSIYKFGYYNQAAFYCDGVQKVYKTEARPPFMFIAQEKAAPFECNFFMADDEMIAVGVRENMRLKKKYKKCLDDNSWPGYEDKVIPVGMASWMLNKLDGVYDE